MTKPIAGKEPKRTYSKHGLHTLKQSVKTLGKRALDQRTTVAKSLMHWRAELVRDLGGPETVSKQQAVVIELAVKTHLLLQSIDNWLLQQKSLINSRKKSVLPVVRERQQLADSLARYMTLLGLERKAKPVPALTEYLTKKYGEKDSNLSG
jgi:hypothetical protein